MKINIGGVRRNAKVIICPKGVYCCKDDYDLPIFPLSVAICEPLTDEEKKMGEVLFIPMFEFKEGYEIEWTNTLWNYVNEGIFRDFVTLQMSEYPDGDMKHIVLDLLTEFKEHSVAVTRDALDFADKVGEGLLYWDGKNIVSV